MSLADKRESDIAARADALLEQAKKLTKQQLARPNSKSSIEETLENIQKVNESVSRVRRFFRYCRETFLGIYERFIGPIFSFVGPPFEWMWQRYKKVWNRYVFVPDPKGGEPVLSRSRSSILVGLTVCVLSIFTPTSLGDAVRFVTVEPIADTVLILATKKTETFYLNNSEEIDHEENIYAVRGCKHDGQCTEKDAAYFRVRPRLAHDLWKLWTYGNPIYVPDHVVAPIAPGVNRCEVTYYGYRMTSSWISRLIRSLQVYPTMLEASCTFLGIENKGTK